MIIALMFGITTTHLGDLFGILRYFDEIGVFGIVADWVVGRL